MSTANGPLSYSAMPLDRCSNSRSNIQWLTQEFNKPSTLFCLVNDDKNFFSQTLPIHPLFLSAQQLPKISLNSCIFLGKDNNRAIFAINSDKISQTDIDKLSVLGQWQPVRTMVSSITAPDAAILALAKALVHWHKTHLYCGKCGSLSHLTDAGHARKCTNHSCRNMNFPRTDPAVIMLVERMCDDGIARCLLGRQKNWPKGMFSTLAGFVDPGETLEEAVIREVLEESCIHVENPQYITSQPWPFPASIMFGYTATAINQNIDTSQDTLHQAKWFSRAELATFVAKEAELPADFNGYRISSADSISSYLITAWKNQQIGQY